MRRGIFLVMLLGVGALSLAVKGQQPQGPNVVDVEKLKDNLYILKGGGGNTGLFVTATGVVVVDTKLPGWGQPLLQKLRTVTDKPITMIINTHAHGDHTSGQLEFPGTIEVVAQENTKTNMQKLDPYKKPENAKFLPKQTFKDKMTLLSGKDRIDLYYFGPGHTNGDAWVVFPELRVVHAGDMFASKGLPLVDTENGGSMTAFPETLAKAHAGIQGVDTIITGHSPTTMTWADLKQFADFNKDFVSWAQSEKRAGKTVDQAVTEYKVPAAYPGYSANVAPYFGGIKTMIQAVYDAAR